MWYNYGVKRQGIDKTDIFRIKADTVAIAIGAALLPLAARAEDGDDDCNTYFDWGGCDIMQVLKTVVGWAAAGVIPAVTVGIIVGAIMYGTSGNNPGQAKQGIAIIRNAIIALLLWGVSAGLLQFLVPAK